MNTRGQTSIEMLFITSVIIVGALGFGMMGLETADMTQAMTITRTEVMVQLNALDTPYVLSRIEASFPNANTLELTIKTIPTRGLQTTDLDLTAIETLIVNNTRFQSVSFRLNPTAAP